MNDNPFVGTWNLMNPKNLGSLHELEIKPGSESGRFTVSSNPPGLDLPDLVYDADAGMLVGSCEGTVCETATTYNVAVIQYGDSPVRCKGVVFVAGAKHREDNSVGTWTADKKGPPTDPPG